MARSSSAELNSRSTSLNVRLYASYSTLIRTITASFLSFHKSLTRGPGDRMSLGLLDPSYLVLAGATLALLVLADFLVPFFFDLVTCAAGAVPLPFLEAPDVVAGALL